MTGVDEILAGYDNLRPGQEDFYRDLHRHPELSHEEHETARRVHEGIGDTGVVGVLANMRSYSAVTRQRMLDAIGRIVRAECQASGSPKDPEFETIFTFPVTDNDAAATGRVATAFLPPLQPTLRTGTEALVTAALAWLAPH